MKIKTRMSLVLSALVLAWSATVYAAPNLAGTWVLDPSLSEFHKQQADGAKEGPDGARPRGHRRGGAQTEGDRPEIKLTVEQSGNALKVTRTVTRGTKERASSETYTVDGTEQTQKGPREGSVVTKALYDGDRLVLNQSHTMTTKKGEMHMSRASVWTVSPDGKMLTVDTTMQGPRGERQMKTVYHKA